MGTAQLMFKADTQYFTPGALVADHKVRAERRAHVRLRLRLRLRVRLKQSCLH